MAKFVGASMKGWKYAVENPDDAAGIVVDAGGQDENHQKRMMGRVAKLIGDRSGKLDAPRSDRTAKALLDRRSSASSPPGAWTQSITDAAAK